ncbi:CPBP family glutamic-type intramembrane protease [Testudinibacter sp. TR-2022]|uniref:CPBP family glutamic-type intramembrane protease n=1 Tax=Testudinibacter sp. TR-2022 TaxID=2585029 RepID=UPI002278A69D|nr:CPBP family glutamic-type intramembrane protease [Testudinibacter sp. TR-2022]
MTWWDVLVLTIIMFSIAIYNSFINYVDLADKQLGEEIEFTSNMNWDNLGVQAVLLALAMCYLRLRNFNFAQWTISINLKSVAQGIGIFLAVALAMDVFFMAWSYVIPFPVSEASVELSSASTALPKIDFSLLLYSALNGFYEEIFFLGICLAVARHQRWLFILYALLIRYAFHTYQGQAAAVGIALVLGGSYYFLYKTIRPKNLFPFFLAHALSDVFGVGILTYLDRII